MKYALTAFPTTDLNDKYPDQVKPCLLPFLNFGKKKTFAGRIRTLVTMEDTKLAQTIFREPGEGAVMVVDGGGSFRTALLGDINAAILEKNNWMGIIINGVIRDGEELAKINLGIKALGTTPVSSNKKGIGAVDVPVAFGNVLFQSYHCIYCDSDGVLVSKEPLEL